MQTIEGLTTLQNHAITLIITFFDNCRLNLMFAGWPGFQEIASVDARRRDSPRTMRCSVQDFTHRDRIVTCGGDKFLRKFDLLFSGYYRKRHLSIISIISKGWCFYDLDAAFFNITRYPVGIYFVSVLVCWH